MNAERSANNTIDKARKLQRALYRAAKQNAARRFHALYDKVYRYDILLKAWERVKANHGAPGIDGVSVKDIEEFGVSQFLSQIQRELQEGTYRPIPVELGSPQGGVISPLLANIYLDYLDQMWEEHGSRLGTLVRYADDAVALCPTRRQAERALKGFERVLGRLKLQLHPEKTKVVCLWQGQEGFDFLGFHHRKEASRRKGWYVPKRWPSQKAERNIRQQVRAVTDRWGPGAPLAALIAALNPKIEGWATYYGHGTAADRFGKLDRYIWERLLRWYNRKHRLHLSRVVGNTRIWLKEQGLKFLGTTVTRRKAKASGEGHRRAV